MIFNVRVAPKASRGLVIKENESFKVYLTRPAQDGLANRQLIGLLSEYLHIRKYQIKIIKGLRSRNKLIQINA